MTLAIHPGYDTEKADKDKAEKEEAAMAKAAGVEVEQVQRLNKSIKKILKNVKNLMTESKMSMIRQDAHNKSVEYNASQSLYMTLFEAIAFMGICAFNLYHIKGILENRRII